MDDGLEMFLGEALHAATPTDEAPPPLSVDASAAPADAPSVRVDPEREARKGVPEVVLAQGKRPDDVILALRTLAERSGRALASRVEPELLARIQRELPDLAIEPHEVARMVVVRRPDARPPRTGGRVGVLTAGSSDVPIAEEAAVVAREMGCDTRAFYDVGVAGIHRLAEPLAELQRWDVDAVIVAAGMDGALPSVVAGLVQAPVIGLPTSVGYGLGGRGVAALLSMLQTCSPGLAVVNIDNGVGAGAMAGLIANRMARARATASAPIV